MNGPSRIRPVLCHLKWLAENVDTPANQGRAYDAAVLTYNAATTLQWYFVFPVSDLDTTANPAAHDEAAGLIDGLVKTARKTVTSAKDDATQDERIRSRLSRAIRKVVDKIPYLLLVGNPVPEWLPELQLAPDIAGLMDEFLAVHAEQHAAALLEGRIAAAKGVAGPHTALKEAIAGLIYIHDDAREADMSPGLRRPLTQMAAGFFKTAVEQQAEESLPPAQKRRLLQLADGLVESDASANP